MALTFCKIFVDRVQTHSKYNNIHEELRYEFLTYDTFLSFIVCDLTFDKDMIWEQWFLSKTHFFFINTRDLPRWSRWHLHGWVRGWMFLLQAYGGHMKVRCNHRVLFSHKMGGWMNCLQGILHNFQIWIAFVTLYIKSSRVNELDQWTSTHKDQNVVTISK